jgi:hypothetical protein
MSEKSIIAGVSPNETPSAVAPEVRSTELGEKTRASDLDMTSSCVIGSFGNGRGGRGSLEISGVRSDEQLASIPTHLANWYPM